MTVILRPSSMRQCDISTLIGRIESPNWTRYFGGLRPHLKYRRKFFLRPRYSANGVESDLSAE